MSRTKNKEALSATINKATADAIRDLSLQKDTIYFGRSYSQNIDLVLQKGLETILKQK